MLIVEIAEKSISSIDSIWETSRQQYVNPIMTNSGGWVALCFREEQTIRTWTLVT
jgi:hypothetical protein